MIRVVFSSRAYPNFRKARHPEAYPEKNWGTFFRTWIYPAFRSAFYTPEFYKFPLTFLFVFCWNSPISLLVVLISKTSRWNSSESAAYCFCSTFRIAGLDHFLLLRFTLRQFHCIYLPLILIDALRCCFQVFLKFRILLDQFLQILFQLIQMGESAFSFSFPIRPLSIGWNPHSWYSPNGGHRFASGLTWKKTGLSVWPGAKKTDYTRRCDRIQLSRHDPRPDNWPDSPRSFDSVD